MSVPLAIALDRTPLLAPILRSKAPTVMPSLAIILSTFDKILPIILKIIPLSFGGLKIITIFAACSRMNTGQIYEKAVRIDRILTKT